MIRARFLPRPSGGAPFRSPVRMRSVVVSLLVCLAVACSSKETDRADPSTGPGGSGSLEPDSGAGGGPLEDAATVPDPDADIAAETDGASAPLESRAIVEPRPLEELPPRIVTVL